MKQRAKKPHVVVIRKPIDDFTKVICCDSKYAAKQIAARYDYTFQVEIKAVVAPNDAK